MRFSFFVLASAALAAGALNVACSHRGAGRKAAPGPSASASNAAAAAAVTAFLADRTKPMTSQIEQKLLLDLSTCKVDDNGIQPSCAAYQTLSRARNRRWQEKKPLAAAAAVGARHIDDASPAVRLQSARLLGGIADQSAPARKQLVAAALEEKVPGVLVAMLRVLGGSSRDPGVSELLLQMADHPAPRVRMEAMRWILTPAGAGIDGGFERVAEKLDGDPSLRVRSYLCSHLYGSDNPHAIAQFKKYLTAKNTPDQLAEACFHGLISAWTGTPLPDQPLKQAYDLTLKVLSLKPRTKHEPPFSAISALRAARTDYEPSDLAGKAWFEKVKPWYKKKRLLAALESLAGDLDAHWLARASALDVMRQLGASRAAFQRVLSHYGQAKGRELSLKRRIEAIIARNMVRKTASKDAKPPRAVQTER